jgi:hypothetical protein
MNRACGSSAFVHTFSTYSDPKPRKVSTRAQQSLHAASASASYSIYKYDDADDDAAGRWSKTDAANCFVLREIARRRLRRHRLRRQVMASQCDSNCVTISSVYTREGRKRTQALCDDTHSARLVISRPSCTSLTTLDMRRAAPQNDAFGRGNPRLRLSFPLCGRPPGQARLQAERTRRL